MTVDVLAEMLRADQSENADFLAHLAHKLEGALPAHTRVERNGGLFSRNKTVASIVVEFHEAHYSMGRERHGPVARKSRVVRGVRLSTREMAVEQWIAEVASELQKLADSSAATRSALEKFIFGN